MESPLSEVIGMHRTRARLVGLQSLHGERLLGDKKMLVLAVIVAQTAAFLFPPDILHFSKRFMNMKDAPKFMSNLFMAILISTGFSCATSVYAYQGTYRNILEEIKLFHLSDSEWAQPILKKNFQKAARRMKLASHFVTFLGVNALIFSIIMGCSLSYLIDNSEYPLPSFYQMSILNVTSRNTYLVNFVLQTILAYSTVVNYQMIGETIILVSISSIAKFDSLIEIISLQEKMSSEDSYAEWIKEVDKQFKNIRRTLLKLKQVNRAWYYVMEKTCYFVILISYLMFNIDKKMMGLCLAGLDIVAGITVLVLLNEMFFSKFEEVNEAIYDLPWYAMTPKQRKALLIFISSSQNPIVMSSAGITDLTLEWFGSVLKGGYSAGLVMKDLITMQ